MLTVQSLLDDLGLEPVLVGGMALVVLGSRRVTRDYDLVVDDINKIPFFSPRHTDLPVLAVVPHLFGSLKHLAVTQGLLWVGMFLLVLFVLIQFPILSTWLPSAMY